MHYNKLSVFVSVIAILCLSSLLSNAQVKPDDITGIWQTPEHLSEIQIYKNGDKYYGKIIWEKEPNDSSGKPKKDNKNPNPGLRSRLIHGLVIIQNLRFNGKEWEGGKIYDPESGNDYKIIAELTDNNTLKVRGYIGISLIGRSSVWKRKTLCQN
jgi:uncharacterized protein (DUF2147 family)